MYEAKLRRLAFGAGLLLSAGSGQAAGLVTYTGMCEPSGAVALPADVLADGFVVANDEDNQLRVYRTAGGAPVAGFDLDTVLAPTPEREADLEGATWLDGKVAWIGSHSRNGEGKRRKDRRQFFETSVAAGETPMLALDPPASLHGLAEAMSALDPTLQGTIRLDVDEQKALAPDNGGLNIEGLAAAPDGTGVLIGLRSPQTATGAAIVIPFANPAAALAGEAPRLGPIVPVGLDGRGIRDMELVPVARKLPDRRRPGGRAPAVRDLPLERQGRRGSGRDPGLGGGARRLPRLHRRGADPLVRRKARFRPQRRRRHLPDAAELPRRAHRPRLNGEPP